MVNDGKCYTLVVRPIHEVDKPAAGVLTIRGLGLATHDSFLRPEDRAAS